MDSITKNEIQECIDYMHSTKSDSGWLTFNNGERLMLLDSKQGDKCAWVTIYDLETLINIF